jgi:hypothetical protein
VRFYGASFKYFEEENKKFILSIFERAECNLEEFLERNRDNKINIEKINIAK